jgi:hypothetical protein
LTIVKERNITVIDVSFYGVYTLRKHKLIYVRDTLKEALYLVQDIKESGFLSYWKELSFEELTMETGIAPDPYSSKKGIYQFNMLDLL